MERRVMTELSNVGRLLRRDAVLGYRGTLIAAASVAGGVILLSLLEMVAGSRGAAGFYPPVFACLLFIGGLIYTSLSLKELHDPVGAVSWLTLPASAATRVATKVLMTAVAYALGATVFTTALAAVSEGLNWLIFRTHHALFNPVSIASLRSLALYLVIQALFLLGAATYRKMALLKTVGVLTLVVTAMLVAMLGVGAILLRDQIVRLPGGRGFTLSNEVQAVLQGITRGTIAEPSPIGVARKISEILFWAALAPVCWVITWLKVREKEV